MQTPTGRLLELLELLQERPLTTGREIADHLEIDARTVNGGVGCDFELENGRKSRRRIEGRIGTGGARFDLAAVNGSVNIDRGLSGRLEARPPAEEAPRGEK